MITVGIGLPQIGTKRRQDGGDELAQDMVFIQTGQFGSLPLRVAREYVLRDFTIA